MNPPPDDALPKFACNECGRRHHRKYESCPCGIMGPHLLKRTPPDAPMLPDDCDNPKHWARLTPEQVKQLGLSTYDGEIILHLRNEPLQKHENTLYWNAQYSFSDEDLAAMPVYGEAVKDSPDFLGQAAAIEQWQAYQLAEHGNTVIKFDPPLGRKDSPASAVDVAKKLGDEFFRRGQMEGQDVPAQGGDQALGDMLENEPDAIAPDTRLGETSTPRTDAEEKIEFLENDWSLHWVSPDFARTLERELAEWQRVTRKTTPAKFESHYNEMCQIADTVNKGIDGLKAELAAAKQDSERLEWLMDYRNNPQAILFWSREEIDAARREEA